jgi:oxygen-independent coproporphyrinogen-3 oxidase
MAGIYIHIPFCKQACYYCDFYFSTSQKNKVEVINAMLIEIALQKNYFDVAETIETIYFGGGTPSLLTIDEFEIIILALNKNFKINKKIEFTVEANPDDITPQKLNELKQLGVNRLSIGIQSFNDNDLKVMNRSHNASHALNCIELANEAGFNNISIDLMYGLPNQTNEKWLENLAIASELNIQHISCYCLTVEERTALHKLIRTKKISDIDENISSMHFTTLMNWAAENKFEQYEISNFAKDGFRAIHNTNYWRNKSYLGIGPSAHSYKKNIRKFNLKNNAQYIKKIDANETTYFEQEILTEAQIINEYLLTNLRTIWGIDIDYISTKFGATHSEEIEKKLKVFAQKKWVENKSGKYFLSNEGKFFADYIASELFI